MASSHPSAAALKLKACDRCASIKQVCDRSGDGSESCSRCTRLGLPCAITRAHKPMGRPRKNRVPAPPLSSDDSDISGPSESSLKTIGASPAPRQKRVQRTRSGCITCKQRRKKCDEVLPTCGDCRRLGLPCSRAPARTVARRGSNSSTSSEETCVSQTPHNVQLSLMLSIMYDGITPQEHHLLQHYTHVVSRSLSVVPDEINSFISLFVPMALQQPAMRNALFGLSATHLKRIHPVYEYVAVEYQNKAVNQANALLRRGDDEAAKEGLAAILFLCMQEICEGGSRRWPMHLEAAVTLINNKGGPTAYPDDIRFLIESVAYFDSVATLSFSKSALLDQQFYVPRDKNATVSAHALFGTAHALFAIIADISQLAQVQSCRYASPAAEANFRQMASALELQLQEWTPVACYQNTTDSTLQQKVTAAGVMLQWAALMRLHLIVESYYDITHPKVRVAVANILTALDTIPMGDLVESMLVFPVFAAGFGAWLPEERRKVRERFEVMEKSIGFGNVFDAHTLVELRWMKMDNEAIMGAECGSLSWERIIAETGQTLIMG